MAILKYKDYEGSAEIDMDSMTCRGKILFIADLITYQATTPAELEAAFIESVEDYLQTCIDLDRNPQKPLRGQFNVRVSPDLHKAAHLRAACDNTSLNDVVIRALDLYLSSAAEVNHNVTFRIDINSDAVQNVIATAGKDDWRTASATTNTKH